MKSITTINFFLEENGFLWRIDEPSVVQRVLYVEDGEYSIIIGGWNAAIKEYGLGGCRSDLLKIPRGTYVHVDSKMGIVKQYSKASLYRRPR